jgi:hypothetical protein
MTSYLVMMDDVIMTSIHMLHSVLYFSTVSRHYWLLHFSSVSIHTQRYIYYKRLWARRTNHCDHLLYRYPFRVLSLPISLTSYHSSSICHDEYNIQQANQN